MFVFWNILTRLIEPFTVLLFLLTIGCLLSWFGAKRKLAKILLTSATGLLLLLAYGVPFNQVAKNLEYRFSPINNIQGLRDVQWIVVLGAGHFTSPNLPANSTLGSSSMYRVVEAVRLYRLLPGSRIIFSGGKTFDEISQADMNGEVALALGVARDQIRLESHPRNTEEEIFCTKQTIGPERFILVTSAMHMPRAVMLSEAYGLHPIPSPTDFRSRAFEREGPQSFLPAAGTPLIASAAFHELVAIAWFRLRSAIGRKPHFGICGS